MSTRPTRRRWLPPVVALLLLGATCWAGLLLGVYSLELDPNSDSRVPGVARVSLALLALGVLSAVVVATLARRWSVLSLSLVVGGVVAAVPWLSLLT